MAIHGVFTAAASILAASTAFAAHARGALAPTMASGMGLHLARGVARHSGHDAALPPRRTHGVAIVLQHPRGKARSASVSLAGAARFTGGTHRHVARDQAATPIMSAIRPATLQISAARKPGNQRPATSIVAKGISHVEPS